MPIAAIACAIGRCVHNVCDDVTAAVTRRAARSARALILAACAAVLAGSSALAADPFEATSSRSARQDAVSKIPFEALSADDQTIVRSIIRRSCIYRRLPTRVIDCDPELFQLLIQNPHVVANTWEVLGLSKLRMTRLDERTFQADDGNGTRGTMRVLWADHGAEAQDQARPSR